MKYLLIENADGYANRVRIFNDPGERAKATREAILGPPSDDNKDLPCPELLKLAADGVVDFEGDPSLQWIDAEIACYNFHTPDTNLPPLAEGPRRKMIVEIEVSADFEKRLDNQWEVEREIHADRWSWKWAESPNDQAH